MPQVSTHVPVRVADVGGWTDTWFGGPGQVCHLAVGPGIHVEADLVDGPAVVRLRAPDIGLDTRVDPATEPHLPHPLLDHPLLDHAVRAVLVDAPLPGSVSLTVHSDIPPGASLGTSAAVVVGILATLTELLDRPRQPAELARLAHLVETERAGRQSGVQDQWAAAMGGAGLLRIDPYPEVAHTPLHLTRETTDALRERLVTVVFEPHDSSATHHAVIRALVDQDPVRLAALRHLADLAPEAARALTAGDLAAWGRVLTECTDTQARLHSDLVGPSHTAGIEVARRHGALGWKVNGAGGAGGSLTVLVADTASRDALAAAFRERWTVVDLAPSTGVRP